MNQLFCPAAAIALAFVVACIIAWILCRIGAISDAEAARLFEERNK